MERGAIKKPCDFRIRNKPVNMTAIARYADRKRKQGNRLRTPSPGVPTPPHITCSTPSPKFSQAGLSNDEQSRTGVENSIQPPQASFHYFMQKERVLDHDEDLEHPLIHLQRHHGISYSSETGYSQRFNHQIHGLPRVVSLPQVVLLPEQLFATITSYFDSCFRTGTWILGEKGHCVSKKAHHITPHHPIAFYHYCESASTFFLQQSPIKGRQVLSKAIDLIPEILRAELPSTLENFLDTILVLKQRRQADIVTILLRYFCKVAAIIFPVDHALNQICRLMAVVDPEHHTAVFSQSWKCATDSFGRSLGRLSPTSVRCEIDFVRRVYGVDDPIRAERYLRNCLRECEHGLGRNDRSSLEILCTLGYRLLEQERYVEAEAIGKDMLQRSQFVTSHLAKVDALELSAKVQYYLDNQVLAECYLRDAVKRASDIGERGNPDRLRNMLLLESWLREWARGNDADKLKQEMGDLIGPDNIDV
jgi:hypothetical protein